MRSVTVLAPAKLNLTLDVTGTRPDGYHTLDMIMQAVSLRERVTLRRSRGLSLSLPGSRVPANEHNTAYKAALAFFHGTGLLAGAAITVEKHVPVRAGMAGGSADAAAVLVGLNELYGARLSAAELCALGAQVGADVPFSIVGGLLLVWQGVPQNFEGNVVVETLEGTFQVIAMGPIAALEIIKHLGTNGGGFLGANSSTPLENPTMLSNLIELYSMMLLPGACVITFGKMVHARRQEAADGMQRAGGLRARGGLSAAIYGREGRSIFAAMGILFVIGLSVCFWAESQGNPALADIGLDQAMGSMEGKEVRFGIAQSAMFTTVTTSFTTGTVNNMHDTLTPLGGMIPLLHMMLNVVFGGKGVGLMNMILYAILAVFICGLMIGRTPEYLGKKIEGREMKLTALCIIIHPLLILAFSALAVGTAAGREGITNPGFHGLSQVLYEYASSAANNGSGFEGLADNTCFWNITAGLAMFFGRYLSIVIQLAIAGSLMKKNFVNESAGTLRTDTVSFSVILVFVVYIFAALTFFPALALGPVAEHLALWG